jgi:hypothetical protein
LLHSHALAVVLSRYVLLLPLAFPFSGLRVRRTFCLLVVVYAHLERRYERELFCYTLEQANMGDYTTETLELQKCKDDEQFARDDLLGEETLKLDEDSIIWILNYIDCFVGQSRGNESVEEVCLYPYSLTGRLEQ